MINLLSNAIKFTEQGRVTLSVSLSEGVGESTCPLRFSVVDTGVGIEKEALDKLFDEFVQADASTTRIYGGTGLGLNICKHLVSMMGGAVSVTSALGEGSTFAFTANLAVAKDADVQSVGSDTDGFIHRDLSGINILLVEDNPLNQVLASEMLGAEGANVVIANDGVECLVTLEERPFDLVLMDMQMPNMDGITATRHIKKQEKFHALPIFAMTANASSEDRKRCIDAGMTNYLTKPIEFDRLIALISRLNLEK